jgi:hypothetical protein
MKNCTKKYGEVACDACVDVMGSKICCASLDWCKNKIFDSIKPKMKELWEENAKPLGYC